MDKRDLIEGTQYQVKIEDCCINAEFTAVFLRYEANSEFEDAEEQRDYGKTYWSNGVTLGPVWGAWFPAATAEV